MRDLPEWVWRVVEEVQRYSDEHPILYRMVDADRYERTQCLDGEISKLIPADVWNAAEIMRLRSQS